MYQAPLAVCKYYEAPHRIFAESNKILRNGATAKGILHGLNERNEGVEWQQFIGADFLFFEATRKKKKIAVPDDF